MCHPDISTKSGKLLNLDLRMKCERVFIINEHDNEDECVF